MAETRELPIAETSAPEEPIVKTNRLTLRPLREADSARLAAIANNIEVARNLTDGFPHPYTVADAEAFRSSECDSLVVVLTKGDTLIGVIGSNDRGVIRPSKDGASACFVLGYWLGFDYWGKGYATEAVRGFVNLIVRNSVVFDIYKECSLVCGCDRCYLSGRHYCPAC